MIRRFLLIPLISLSFFIGCLSDGEITFDQNLTEKEFTETPKADLFSYQDSDILTPQEAGDYVIYWNHFGGNDFLITIIYIGENRYFLRTANRNTGEINEFSMEMGLEEGNLRMLSMGISEGKINNQELQFTQIDFMNMCEWRKHVDVGKFPEQILSEDPWPEFGYTLMYDFQYWVPMLNMYSRYDIDNQESSIELVKFGKMTSENEDPVLSFHPEDLESDLSPSLKIPEKEETTIVFDGLGIPLDENWSIYPDSNAAVYEVKGERYSYINVMTIPLSEVAISYYQLFTSELMNNNDAHIFPESVKISEINGYPTLQYLIREPNGNDTKSILFVMERDDYVSIIMFGAYNNFYENNREYFENILF